LPTLRYFLFDSQIFYFFKGDGECIRISRPHIFLIQFYGSRTNGSLAFALPIAIGTPTEYSDNKTIFLRILTKINYIEYKIEKRKTDKERNH
jgi:hypothetical protein